MQKILYIDMDGVLVDFESAFRHISDSVLSEYEGREDDIPGIFRHMEPVPGAVEAYCELAGLYDTYVLSTAPWENPTAWSDKVSWVKTHLGEVARKRLILSHHKDLCRGHYLIDDRRARGAAEFQGELLLFRSEEYPDWPAVVRYLKSLAEQEEAGRAAAEHPKHAAPEREAT